MRRDGNGRERGHLRDAAANDNPGSGPGQAWAGGGPEARVEDAVMRLARLIGRQIAREQFVRQSEAANDNAPEKEAHDR